MASPYAISGNLNFTNLMCNYEAYLQANQTNYNNIISGYNTLASALCASGQKIQAGYCALEKSVLGTIACACKSQMEAVQATYTQNNANTQQQMINAGLGNSTVLASLQAGNVSQEAQAQTAVKDQFAQLYAGYQSSLGQAALAYQGQLQQEQAALGECQLKFMAGINITPPVRQQPPVGGISSGGMPTMPKGAGTPARGSAGTTTPYGSGSYGAGGFFACGTCKNPQMSYACGLPPSGLTKCGLSLTNYGAAAGNSSALQGIYGYTPGTGCPNNMAPAQ